MTMAWPPSVGARVQNASGDAFVVTAHHSNAMLGDFVVVKRTFVGGWECVPVTVEEWFRDGYRAAR